MSEQINTKDLRPLIDGDILQYSCGFAADAQVRKEFQEAHPEATPEEVAAYCDNLDYVTFALGNVKSVLTAILDKFNREYRLFLTGSGNFREHIATILPYKGNRDPNHKPKYYSEIKQYLIEVWKAEVIHGREADDALGCAQWEAKNRDTVIVTIDKDLNGIPGHHYNWRKDEFFDVNVFEANAFFFRQMLEGDRTDNIPGIHRVGPKTVDKLFQGLTTIEEIRTIVQQQYQKQYGPEAWEAAYQEVADLLWMQRLEGKGCPFLH